uniref:C2H2-type domain-containing protein n=1 Tax=Romanomermis culicivorax TaxID=13658 RepID=A0A915JEJ1_ROMCU
MYDKYVVACRLDRKNYKTTHVWSVVYDYDLRKIRAAQFFEKFLADKLRLGDQAHSQDITIDEKKSTLDQMTANPTILSNFADQFNYAVMLASLAASQMNFVRGPLESSHQQQEQLQHRHRSVQGPLGHLPLLYPNLCDSLFNNVQQQQQKNLEQQKREQLIHKLFDLKENGSKSLPATTEKDASFSPRSKGQTTKTPSPRKRVGSFKTISRKRECHDLGCSPKKIRAMRRIQFDDEKCSPVSGMYIKDLPPCAVGVADQSSDCSSAVLISTNQNYANNSALRNQPDGGDQLLLDDSAEWVEASEDARRQLAEIPNIIGDYVCKLCRQKFEDAFKLAKHKCPRIGHQEYRCPECDKTFSCPANLASHRRWHKPKNAMLHQEPTSKEYGDAPEDPQAPVDLTNKKS